MEMPSTGSSEVIDKALEYAEEMMQAVMNCEPCGNVREIWRLISF